jgi:hypothetical protein
VSDAYAKVQAAGQSLVATYKRISAARPSDPSWLLALIDASRQTNDVATMVTSAKRFLKLAPDDPTAPQIRQLLKQGEAYLKTQPSATPSSGSR